MTTPKHAHVVRADAGAVAELGIARMRILAGEDVTRGAFALTEFAGGEGPWTIPHVHEHMEESFYVLDGELTFTIANDTVVADAGSYVLVPRGTRHVLAAGAGGARCLTLMVPGGLERMFLELATLPGDSLRDPVVRSRIASRYDSVPS